MRWFVSSFWQLVNEQSHRTVLQLYNEAFNIAHQQTSSPQNIPKHHAVRQLITGGGQEYKGMIVTISRLIRRALIDFRRSFRMTSQSFKSAPRGYIARAAAEALTALSQSRYGRQFFSWATQEFLSVLRPITQRSIVFAIAENPLLRHANN